MSFSKTCLLLALGLSPLFGQAPTVSRNTLSLSGVQGGSAPGKVVVQVTSETPWTAKLGTGTEYMLAISPASGTASGPLTVALVGWWLESIRPGTHRQTVIVTNAAGSVTINVAVEVAPRAALPTFSYMSPKGPTGCEKPRDLPNPAICTVPDEKPPGNFRPPPPGGSYVDPNFGAQVRVLAGPKALHGYSSPSAISAANRYVLTAEDDIVRVRDLASGKIVRSPQIPLSGQGAMWDARNAPLLYYFSGAKVMRYNVEKNDTDTIADLGSRFRGITAGGTGDNSKDNWISFYAPAETTVCAMSLEAPANVYCANYSQVPNGPHRPDYSTIAKGVDSKSGKRYVLLASAPAMLFFSVNEGAKRLDFEYRGGEGTNSKGNNDGICDPGEPCLSTPHADTFEHDGEQYLITAVESFEPCGYYLVTYKLNVHDKPGLRAELGGGMKVIMQLFRCGGSDAWVDEHYGCAKASPHCVVSTTYGGFKAQRADNDMTPIKRTAHLSEIFVVSGNGANVLRLMQNRSVPLKSEPDYSYWTAPRACMSPDGSHVVADSNFGEANKHRVLVIPTGLGPPKVAEGGIVDAASYASRLSRGSLFTIFGENLSGCVEFSPSFPLPSDICGTSVFFNGAASSLVHASPGQVTGIVPDAGGGSMRVEVQRLSSEGAVKTEAPLDALAEAAPSLFEYGLTDGSRHVVAQGADYALIGPETSYSRPLKRGEVGILYANGLGATDRPVQDFDPAPLQPLVKAANPVEVIVNDVAQNVIFAGLAPALSRIFQVNFELKTDTPVQPVNEIYVRVRGSESQRSRLAIAP